MIKSQTAKWEDWHTTWLDKETTPTDKVKCLDWMLGVELAASLATPPVGESPVTSPSADSASTKPATLSVCAQEEFQGQKVNRYHTAAATTASEMKPPVVVAAVAAAESALPPPPVATETMETD